MQVQEASAPTVDARGLWLPRVTYTNGTGATVELIGMAHMADQQFFTNVRARLDQATDRGERVCVEGVRRLTKPERRALNTTQLDAIDTMTETLDAIYQLLPDLGLAYQGEALCPDTENWVRTDMNQLEFTRALGVKGIRWLRRLGYPLNWIRTQYPDGLPPQLGGDRDTLINILGNANHATGSNLIRSMIRRMVLDQRVILDQRNDLAARGILSAINQHRADVVATWGNAHLEGIGNRLTAVGFRPVARQQHLAIARDRVQGSAT